MKYVKKLFPPATIGLIGGGQLGRMFTFEAKRMGYHVIVLDPKKNSPAGQVADEQIVAPFDDEKALFELASKSEIITYEFEHIDVQAISILEKAGKRIIPSSNTLRIIQNKYEQKNFLKALNVKTAEYFFVNDEAELHHTFFNFNSKCVVKSCTNGYDGKGNYIVRKREDVHLAMQYFRNLEIFAEAFIDYSMELSIIIIKCNDGITFYPVSENVHQDNILIKAVVPAAISEHTNNKIKKISEKIVNAFDDYGVYCIEFFLDKEGEVYVNEIAPRPHNSGHYTIEGCVTSQYEQLVRVVCGMNAGSSRLIKPCAMHNVLGNHHVSGEYKIMGLDDLLEMEDVHFHLYGKPDTSNLRKIGHITAVADTPEIAINKVTEAFQKLRIDERRTGNE